MGPKKDAARAQSSGALRAWGTGKPGCATQEKEGMGTGGSGAQAHCLNSTLQVPFQLAFTEPFPGWGSVFLLKMGASQGSDHVFSLD